MSKHQQRRAYTLIELLVVIGLIALLAALTLTFLPNFASSQTESRAAMNVQTWLNMAKQKALRDQATRGVRFTLSSGTYGSVTLNNICTDAQFVEQPEDFSGGSLFSPNPAPVGYSRTNCLVMTADITNGYAPVASPPIPYNTNDPNRLFWNVQPGDYLEVLGTGLMHQIVQVGVVVAGNVNSTVIVITPPLGFPIDQPTQNYRVVRSPRPVGEDLKLPEGTIIDFATNVTYSSPYPQITNPSIGSGFVDILFSQSGAVISPGVTTGNINLWIRAPDPRPPFETDPYRGDPSIISVFVKTGLVGAFPPAQGANPYALVY